MGLSKKQFMAKTTIAGTVWQEITNIVNWQ